MGVESQERADGLENEPQAEAPPSGGSQRLRALDVFRGLSVGGMILVNNPGGRPSYSPLLHAEWDGLTPTDLVFPSFVFIVGVSITLALSKRLAEGVSSDQLLGKILRRSAVIFGLGILLHAFPKFNNWDTIRIPGVLQRLALCYLFGSLIFITTKARGQAILAAVLLIGYYLAMTYIPAPGRSAGDLSRPGNLAAYIDRSVLPGHIYKPDYDPEGILSTLPAIATTLLGILAGHLLRSARTIEQKTLGLFVAGSVALVAGYFWGLVFPINKALWTSSFVLVTAGIALQVLGLCIWLIDIKGHAKWSAPFGVLGRNPLAAYVLAGLLARALGMITVAGPEGKPISAKAFLYNGFITPYLSPINASLAYSLLFVTTCFLVIVILDVLDIRIRA